MSVYTLFPYQDEAIRKGLEVLMSEKQRREVLVAPVAAGKSIIIAEIVKRLPNDYKILVLQPNKELTEQNVDKIEKLGVKVAVYSASLGRKELGRVTYATPGSVNVNEFKKFGFNVALVDEADFSSKDGTSLKPNMEGIGIKNVLGLTATPIYMQPTMDGSVLKIMHRTRGAFFRNICHVVQIEEVRKENRWSELKYIEYEFDSKGLILNSTGADFTEESIITNYVEAGTEDKILSIVETLGEERALVFVPGIENVESLYKTLEKNGVSVGLVHSKIGMKDRAETLKSFRNKEIQVLINSLVLTCLDSKTELLTKDGWKMYNEISYDDEIAQYEEGEITFSKPSNIHIDPEYDGNFVSVSGGLNNIRVTEDHDVLCTSGRNLKFKKAFAKDIVGKKRYIPVSGISKPDNFKFENPYKLNCKDGRFISYNSWVYRQKGYSEEFAKLKAEELLKQKKSLYVKQPNELTLDECKFIGFFVGDGCRHHSHNKGKKDGIRYSLAQSTKYPKMNKWIEDVLQNIGVGYSVSHRKDTKDIILGNKCNVSDHLVYTLNLGTGGDGQKVESTLFSLTPYLHKNFPEYLSSLNREQFFAFMDGLFKADGTHKDCNEYDGSAIVTKYKFLADEIQRVAVCRGFRCIVSKHQRGENKPLYYVSMSDKDRVQLVNNRLELEESKGKELVWCVTMPKGTIVTRREGRVSITGNCGYDDPSLENLIDAFPTNSARVNYQKIGRIVRVGKKVGKVHCISGNYEKFGSIEDITFEDIENYGWGMFVKGLLVSGVPMRENIKITREDLKNGKVKTNKKKTKNKRYSNYDFVYQGNLMSETFAFGKYFGKTFEYVYERDKGYLFWMYKQIKENKAFQEIKHRPIRNKVIELYDKKLPF